MIKKQSGQMRKKRNKELTIGEFRIKMRCGREKKTEKVGQKTDQEKGEEE